MIRIVLCLFLLTSTLYSAEGTIDNPQLQMVGARVSTLGVTNPTIISDINATMINPASLGGVESMPVAISNKRVLNAFKYQVINMGVPIDLRLPLRKDKRVLQKITFGLTYGKLALHDIPRTIIDEGQIWDTGTFSSGFEVYGLSAGTSFYQVYGFDVFSIGTTLKKTQFYLGGIENSATGFDGGIIATRYINNFFIDKLSLGAVVHNLIAPTIVSTETNNTFLLPFQLYTGLRADLFEDKATLFAHNGINGLSVGGEYHIQDTIALRGSTDFTGLSMGTGILFERVASGFGNRDYSLRFDYNYTQNAFPMDSDPTHTLSLSILGESRPKAPKILHPQEEMVMTQKRTIRLAGVSPKNTTIRIYNNHELSRTAVSDKFGNWVSPYFPLEEGKNYIFVKSFALEKDASLQSFPIMVYSDTEPPQLQVSLDPEGEKLKVNVLANEDLSRIDGQVGPHAFAFSRVGAPPNLENPSFEMKPSLWTATIPMVKSMESGSVVPNELEYVTLMAKDIAGNKVETSDTSFFIAVTFPHDKYVHYKESLRFIGFSSTMVETINVNGYPVYIDEHNRFAIPVPLERGKNLVNFNLFTHNEKELNYNMRVLRLETFPDLNSKVKGRREIEFLATLGVLQGDKDGNFYPDKPVTREYVTRLMVDSSDDIEVPETVSGALFPDVPQNYPYANYIQAAIEAGLIFAYPDGTFRPEQALTLSEAIFMLSNAGIIEYQEVDDTQSQYVLRRQLAEFLAYTPKYEIKIERLIDWDKGYN